MTEFFATAKLSAVAMEAEIMASRRSEHQAEIRHTILRLISKNPKVSTRQLADEVGISNGSAYYVVTALIEKGLVKLGNLKSNSRKKDYAYLLTKKGLREKSLLTKNFIGRKYQEYENLKAEIRALEKEAGYDVDKNLDQKLKS